MNIVKDAPIPTGSALKVVSGQKIVLEPQDSIAVTATASVDVVCAILEDIN